MHECQTDYTVQVDTNLLDRIDSHKLSYHLITTTSELCYV